MATASNFDVGRGSFDDTVFCKLLFFMFLKEKSYFSSGLCTYICSDAVSGMGYRFCRLIRRVGGHRNGAASAAPPPPPFTRPKVRRPNFEDFTVFYNDPAELQDHCVFFEPRREPLHQMRG